MSSEQNSVRWFNYTETKHEMAADWHAERFSQSYKEEAHDFSHGRNPTMYFTTNERWATDSPRQSKLL